MKTEHIALAHAAPGNRISLTVYRYGVPGARPKAYVHAALHADEVPAMLAAQQLRRLLEQAEAAGHMRGEVILIPAANPLGMAQQVLRQYVGRFDLRDGINFNRGYPDLASAAAPRLRHALTDDAVANDALIRRELARAAAACVASNATEDLKHKLLELAADADIVLDIHCDHEAEMHLYANTPQRALAEELGALLGAKAILLSEVSGDSPFDEACSTPWTKLRSLFAAHPISDGCFSSTVELRGHADTSHALALHDASALFAFLQRRGVIDGPARELPPAQCAATPLAASEPVMAPVGGVVVFRAAVGERVAARQAIADIVDPVHGGVSEVRAESAGLFYARFRGRWAMPGQRLGKIAGTTLTRSGKLLSP